MKEQEVSIQKAMLFNTVGSVLYYACQWFTTVVIVHTSGYSAAGVLSLAMSVTAAPSIVSLFNVRNYQVSDLKGQYSTETYLKSRTYTNLLSYLICVLVVLAGGYSAEKAAVILVFMLYKLAEGYADVYYGVEQRYGRLDYAGISLTLRGIGSIAIFTAVLLVCNNLLLALLLMTVYSFLIVFVCDRRWTAGWRSAEREQASAQESGRKAIFQLLVTCFPLAVVASLNNLSFNLAKIALENYYGSEVMGYYSSVASPTLVVNLAASTLFAPLIPPLTRAFREGDKHTFYGILKKFALLMAALTVVCLIGSKLLARWGLMLIFGSSIEPYVYLFVPIIVVTILLALNTSLFGICTLLREIKSQYVIGFAGILTAVVTALTVVKDGGMMGVVYAQLLTVAVQTLIQIVIIAWALHRRWGSGEKQKCSEKNV
jgi:O-antigen/teichoic acid export membrane protein